MSKKLLVIHMHISKPIHIIFRLLILTLLPKPVKQMPPMHFWGDFFLSLSARASWFCPPCSGKQQVHATYFFSWHMNQYRRQGNCWCSICEKKDSLAKFSFRKNVDVFKCCNFSVQCCQLMEGRSWVVLIYHRKQRRRKGWWTEN